MLSLVFLCSLWIRTARLCTRGLRWQAQILTEWKWSSASCCMLSAPASWLSTGWWAIWAPPERLSALPHGALSTKTGTTERSMRGGSVRGALGLVDLLLPQESLLSHSFFPPKVAQLPQHGPLHHFSHIYDTSCLLNFHQNIVKGRIRSPPMHQQKSKNW